MKKVVAVSAPKPRSPLARNVAWGYAGVLVVMVVGQLFAFEKFIPALQDYGVTHAEAVVVASAIVVLEVLSLPFLLRMPLSPLMRLMSGTFSTMVALLWLIVSVSVIGDDANGLLFGTKVHISTTLQLVLSLLLVVVSSYTAYGLKLGHDRK